MAQLELVVRFVLMVCCICSVFSDTYICDGINFQCAGATVDCADNEPCLVRCAGGGDCDGITINCPDGAACKVECQNPATAKTSSIYATSSTSLLIDQNVKDGFQSSNIYCPLFGECELTGSGTKAFANVQIYASFGFVFGSVSITCTGNCRSGATMNCGNQYASNCAIDTTANQCFNAPLVCDTIFTTITNEWNDDYSINAAPGWIVTDYNNVSINAVYTGTSSQYHGPFFGESDEPTSNVEKYSLIQYFYCAQTASVYVEYLYAFSCQEEADYTRLYINDELEAEANSVASTGTAFNDDSLENSVRPKCNDAWKQKQVSGSSDEIAANTLFKVEIEVAMNWLNETSVIHAIHMECLLPTPMPTQPPTTAQPTEFMVPTTVPTQVPSAMPTTSRRPTLNPTTAEPTASPVTIAPTASPVTIAPTVETHTPTVAPTSLPTQPTKAPNRGQGRNDNLQIFPAQKAQTITSDDVDLEGLIVAISVIGGLFVVTVIIAVKVYMRHETLHRPIYNQRKEEILAARLDANDLNQRESVSGDIEMEELQTGDGYSQYTETR